jgi:hypothetical protein
MMDSARAQPILLAAFDDVHLPDRHYLGKRLHHMLSSASTPS